MSYAPSLTFLAQTLAAPLTRPARLLAVGNPALANPAAAGEEGLPGAVLVDDEARPLPDAERQVRALTEL